MDATVKLERHRDDVQKDVGRAIDSLISVTSEAACAVQLTELAESLRALVDLARACGHHHRSSAVGDCVRYAGGADTVTAAVLRIEGELDKLGLASDDEPNAWPAEAELRRGLLIEGAERRGSLRPVGRDGVQSDAS